jgi:hypothetical protein
MRQRNLDLGDSQVPAGQVDGKSGLHAEAAGKRARRLERGPGEAALAVQRLRRLPSDGPADAGSGQPDHQPVAAQLDCRGEDGDRHVRLTGDHRFGQRARERRGSAEVRVQEEQMPVLAAVLLLIEQADRLGAGFHCCCLALVTGVPHDGSTRVLGSAGSTVS